ncbi:hypothetical protein [Paenibacillus turpanensis]|uniref:hypothetical protein n=1 Tax=Paenibacillus turpanensis TaxID=2689078 RepID=UPI001408E7E7|nr:hypothetical protein [Paenibacillus turpanensis]
MNARTLGEIAGESKRRAQTIDQIKDKSYMKQGQEEKNHFTELVQKPRYEVE